MAPLPVEPGGVEGLLRSYTSLVERQDLTAPFVLFAVLVSMLLGTAIVIGAGIYISAVGRKTVDKNHGIWR